MKTKPELLPAGSLQIRFAAGFVAFLRRYI